MESYVTYTCRISGLPVRAKMELPGVGPAPVEPGREDVRIHTRPVPENLRGVTARARVRELDERRFLLRAASVAFGGRAHVFCGRSMDDSVGALKAHCRSFGSEALC